MLGYLSDFDGNLFDPFRRLQQEMDELFGVRTGETGIRSVGRGGFPLVNVGITAEQVGVYLFAPGVEMGSLTIEMQKNLLTVSGKREVADEEDATYYRRERFSDTFHRVITLPEDVDPDQVEASYQNGVLSIVVQRSEASKPRQIKVK